MMGTMVNPMPVEDPVSCLLLYKPSAFSADELVTMLPRILNGARSPAPGMLCVLTSQETVDVPIIRWRLSKARVARMKAEGWVMVAYRTDVQLSCEFLKSALNHAVDERSQSPLRYLQVNGERCKSSRHPLGLASKTKMSERML